MTAPWGRPVRLSPADMIRLGLVGIRTRRMRASLSALGISIGIATMIVVTGIPASSRSALDAELTALGTDRLSAIAEAKPGSREAPSFPPEAVEMVARIGPVREVSAVANTHSIVRRSDRIPRSDAAGVTVLASKLNLLPVIKGRMRSGEFLDRGTDRYPAVVLGSVAAARLGYPALRPGSPPPQVLIDQRWFSVIGILHTVPLAPDIDRSVLIGWDAARTELHFDGRPTQLFLSAAEPAIEDVHAVLPATINPLSPSTVFVSRPSDALTAKRSAEATFSGLFVGLAAVALVVGGVGVANTMVISVLERRHEIGLRRALGANRGQIRGQFLTESIALSGMGGIAGVVLGVLATVGYATLKHWPSVLPAASVGGGLAGALVVGIVAGVYPAIRASRLSPTEALASV